MKKLLFVSLIIVTMLLSACQQDLPPEPGSVDVVGQAAGYEDFYAEPDDFWVDNDPLLYWPQQTQATALARVAAQYTWHTGYYLSLTEKKWVPFEFQGEKVGSKWVGPNNQAQSEHIYYDIDEIDDDVPGVILAYSCNKEGETWNCHGNKWMLLTFNFNYAECSNDDKRCFTVDSVETCVDRVWKVTQKCSALEICKDGVCVLDLPSEPEGPGIPDDEEDILKLDSPQNKYNMYDTIRDVWNTRLTSKELSTLLATETYVDDEGDNIGEYTYDQYLYLGLGNLKTGEFNFFVPEDEDLNYYLKLDKNREIYRYQLEFSQFVQFDLGDENGDFAGTEIRIQGRDYIITYADALGGVLYKLVLLSGDTRVWLVQDQPYTVGGHIVQVVDVNNEEDKCGVNVDDVTQWIDVGTTEEFQDLSVGVIDAMVVNTQDMDKDTCELMLGAVEIELEDGEEVVINYEKLDGSEVQFYGSTGIFTGFSVIYVGGQEDEGVNSDDVYIGESQAWVDPVFGEWNLLFSSIDYKIDEKAEEITFSSYYDEGTLTFKNRGGEEVTIPYYWNDYFDQILLGYGSDEPLLVPTQKHIGEPEDVMLLYVDSEGKAHVLQIDYLECYYPDNAEISIYDLTYDSLVTDNYQTNCDGLPNDIDIGSFGSVILTLTNNSVEYNYPNTTNVITTKYDATIYLDARGFTVVEQQGPEQPKSSIHVILTYDVVDQRLEVDTVMIDNAVPNWQDISSYDDDVQWVTTERGSAIAFDAEDRGLIEIYHPAEETTANVYITKLGENVPLPQPLPERCQFPVGLDCVDRANICPGTDKIKFVLRNNIGFAIRPLNIEVEQCGAFGVTMPEIVQNNEVFPISAYCQDLVENQRYTFNVMVEYEITETGIRNQAHGEIVGIADDPDYTCGDVHHRDLAEYPYPYVDKGSIVGKIVVGAQASTFDVLSAIDIAEGLYQSIGVEQSNINNETVFLGVAILDSDVTDMYSENYISVGNPCVNTLSAELLGNPVNCIEGFEQGKALLKLFTAGDKTHLLVAGYSDMDTRGAALVLRNYDDYDLQGDEVEVVVASLDHITVNTI